MSARLIQIKTGELPIPAIEEAAATLERGGLVVLPTDTVYGLCCRAGRPDAIRRVYEAKGRPGDKPLPFLIPDMDAVQNFVNRVSPAAQRLMDRYWPGALTMVLGPGPGVALRLPDHQLAREVLRSVAGPVHATSANLSGESDAMTGADAHRALGGRVELVLDGGRTPGGGASSIVRVPDEGPVTVLRDGGIPSTELLGVGRFTVALVCTGNTCRSPMAAALLRHKLAERLGGAPDDLPLVGVEVVSAGVMAWPGSPMTAEAGEALESEGITVPPHASQPWSEDLASRVDRALVMTPSHLDALLSATPAMEGRASLLDPEGTAVSDPIGGDLQVYRDCLRRMNGFLDGWIERWLPSDAS